MPATDERPRDACLKAAGLLLGVNAIVFGGWQLARTRPRLADWMTRWFTRQQKQQQRRQRYHCTLQNASSRSPFASTPSPAVRDTTTQDTCGSQCTAQNMHIWPKTRVSWLDCCICLHHSKVDPKSPSNYRSARRPHLFGGALRSQSAMQKSSHVWCTKEDNSHFAIVRDVAREVYPTEPRVHAEAQGVQRLARCKRRQIGHTPDPPHATRVSHCDRGLELKHSSELSGLRGVKSLRSLSLLTRDYIPLVASCFSHSSLIHFGYNMTAMCCCLQLAAMSPCCVIASTHWVGPLSVYLTCGAIGSLLDRHSDCYTSDTSTYNVDREHRHTTSQATLGASGAVVGLVGMLATDGTLAHVLGVTGTPAVLCVSGLIWVAGFVKLATLCCCHDTTSSGGQQYSEHKKGSSASDVVSVDHFAHLGGWIGGAGFGVLNHMLYSVMSI
jgi:membrane associated rhomboid family serine protease